MVSIRYLGDEQSKKLALVFPGRGYNLDLPLMYYSACLLSELGWQVWGVDYNYRAKAEGEEQRLKAEVGWVVDQARGRFEQTLLLGKSLGTTAMAFAYQDPSLQNSKGVWLTPLMQHPAVIETMLSVANGLVVYGTQDPANDPSHKPKLEAKHRVLEIPGANHSLEVESSLASVGQLQTYLEHLAEYAS